MCEREGGRERERERERKRERERERERINVSTVSYPQNISQKIYSNVSK